MQRKDAVNMEKEFQVWLNELRLVVALSGDLGLVKTGKQNVTSNHIVMLLEVFDTMKSFFSSLTPNSNIN